MAEHEGASFFGSLGDFDPGATAQAAFGMGDPRINDTDPAIGEYTTEGQEDRRYHSGARYREIAEGVAAGSDQLSADLWGALQRAYERETQE